MFCNFIASAIAKRDICRRTNVSCYMINGSNLIITSISTLIGLEVGTGGEEGLGGRGEEGEKGSEGEKGEEG